MVDRLRLPGLVTTAALGALTALGPLALCVAIGAVAAQQVLIGGSTPDWGTPAVAALLGVLGSAGPVELANDTADGLIRVSTDIGAVPWVLVAAVPMILVARRSGPRLSDSQLGEVGFALGYGLTMGLGVGLLALWAVAVEPGLVLPVSPDRVAGRSILIALGAVLILRLPDRWPALTRLTRPFLVGAVVMAVTAAAIWVAGLLVAVSLVPTGVQQGLTTAGAIVGGNLTTAVAFEAVGVTTDMTVRSEITGTVDRFTVGDASTLVEAGIAVAGTVVIVLAVLVALRVAFRGPSGQLPTIWSVLGVALGVASAGAGLAWLISGTIDAIVLPATGAGRTVSLTNLRVGPGDAFTQLGARAVFAGLPALLLGVGRQPDESLAPPAATVPAEAPTMQMSVNP